MKVIPEEPKMLRMRKKEKPRVVIAAEASLPPGGKDNRNIDYHISETAGAPPDDPDDNESRQTKYVVFDPSRTNNPIPSDPKDTFKIENLQGARIYKGLDGRVYNNPQRLFEANKRAIESNYEPRREGNVFVAFDGSRYNTLGDAQKGNEEYLKLMKKVIDRLFGS